MDLTIATAAYADIFDFPLAREELVRWMIKAHRPNLTKLQQKDGYYFLKGREGIVSLRKKRSIWQPDKWDIARRAAKVLSSIPMVRLVGVTGGLAMNNADQADDIDLFIVVADRWLWTTRFLATLSMDLVGLRRHPNDSKVANKVCLNMFVSTLAVPAAERDLFSAHEVLQMEPIADKGSTYKKFLAANSWTQKFLPNAWRYRHDH